MKRIIKIVLINLVIVAVLLAAVELALRLIRPGDLPPATPPDGPAAPSPSLRVDASQPIYLVENGRVRTNPAHAAAIRAGQGVPYGFIPVDLVVPKPSHMRRIVLVGSSPMRGAGNEPGQSTADSLRRSCETLYPDTTYEIIDAALPNGFADHIAWILTQVEPLDADLVVIWPSGASVVYADQEPRLYGDRGTRKQIAAFLQQSYTYATLRELLNTIGSPEEENRPLDNMTEDPARTDPELARFLENLNQAAADAYVQLLDQTLARAKADGYRMLVIIPPTCLACTPPLFSIHAPSIHPEQARRFAELMNEGEKLLSAEQFAAAGAKLEEAVKIDPTYARARYLLGAALRRQGLADRAREELIAAATYDASIESIKEPPDASTREIAARYGMPTFDLEQFLREILPDGIPDQNAMADLTHLRMPVQQQFTRALAQQLHENWPAE